MSPQQAPSKTLARPKRRRAATHRRDGITEGSLRRWLALLHRPDRLALPELEQLLQIHDRLPPNGSTVEMGRAAADLLTEAIDRLEPPGEATREERLPYEVLKICFLDGAKLWQAANKLGMSERQMTRERTRVEALLFELGEYLRSRRKPDLAAYMAEALPTPDTALATRLALKASPARHTSWSSTTTTSWTMTGWSGGLIQHLRGRGPRRPSQYQRPDNRFIAYVPSAGLTPSRANQRARPHRCRSR